MEEEKFKDSFRLLYISELSKQAIQTLINEVSDVVAAEVVAVNAKDDKKSKATTGPSTPAVKKKLSTLNYPDGSH